MKIAALGLFTLVLITAVTPVLAVRVEESQLTEDAITVILTEREVLILQESTDRDAYRLGEQVAFKLIDLAGIPESITGKVAAFTAWVPMVEKYTRDMKQAVKDVPRGNSLTLKYQGVNLEAVRRLWNVSAAGDYIMPGGELTRKAAGTANDILNIYLKARKQ